MRHLIFFCSLLAACCVAPFTARSQTRPTAAPLSDSAAQVARDDTAIAVQRLFRLQRHTSVRILVLSSIVAGGTTYSLVNNHPETTYQRVSTIGLMALASYGLFQVSSAIIQRWRYRTRQEEKQLNLLDQSKPLPHWVRTKLTAAYFGSRARTQ